MYLFQSVFLFSLDIYPGVEFLVHMKPLSIWTTPGGYFGPGSLLYSIWYSTPPVQHSHLASLLASQNQYV